ncbi:MAG: hypothetical protein ACJ76Y_19770 [Thermoanaerobaculia bacterium]
MSSRQDPKDGGKDRTDHNDHKGPKSPSDITSPDVIPDVDPTGYTGGSGKR